MTLSDLIRELRQVILEHPEAAEAPVRLLMDGHEATPQVVVFEFGVTYLEVEDK